MELGPIEYLMLSFPSNRFDGTISRAIGDLVERGTIRILDLTFIIKDADGTVAAFEYDEIDDGAAFRDIDGHADGLLSEEDLAIAGEALAPDSSALLMLWEDVWANDFVTAVRGCGGEVVTGSRVPHDIAQAAFAGIDS